MRTILAESVPEAIAGYASAAEAICASQEENRAWIAQSGIASCFGQGIIESCWSDKHVVLRLASDDVIEVRCDGAGVKCDRVSSADLGAAETPNAEDGTVELQLRNTTSTWNRDWLIRRLVGRTLANIQISGRSLFLYVSELPVICFGTMRNRNTRNLFLFWSESD
jgi:hypothetical protein